MASSVFVPTNTQNRLPAVTPEVCFCSLVAPAPKPLFAEFHSAATHRSGAFFLPPAEIFRKWRGWLTSIIANFPVEGNGIFQNPSGSQSRSQTSGAVCSKGLGCYPNKQNLRFTASPEIVVLSVCIYKRSACPVAHGCCFRRLSTKFFPTALTGTSVCATIMWN